MAQIENGQSKYPTVGHYVVANRAEVAKKLGLDPNTSLWGEKGLVNAFTNKNMGKSIYEKDDSDNKYFNNMKPNELIFNNDLKTPAVTKKQDSIFKKTPEKIIEPVAIKKTPETKIEPATQDISKPLLKPKDESSIDFPEGFEYSPEIAKLIPQTKDGSGEDFKATVAKINQFLEEEVQTEEGRLAQSTTPPTIDNAKSTHEITPKKTKIKPPAEKPSLKPKDESATALPKGFRPSKELLALGDKIYEGKNTEEERVQFEQLLKKEIAESSVKANPAEIRAQLEEKYKEEYPNMGKEQLRIMVNVDMQNRGYPAPNN